MDSFLQFSDSEITAIALSIRVAVYCALIALPPSVALGFFLARKSFFGKSIVESIVALPLVMPPVTTGYLLLLVLGSRGVAGKWLFSLFGVRLPFTFLAAVVASVVVSFPLLVRSVRTSMEMVDTGMEDESRILGAGKVATFFRVTVPLALPGIISGTILAFARSLGEFGATITFAGNIEGVTRTLPLAIYSYMQVPGQETATLRLVLSSVVISFAVMVCSEYLTKKTRAR